MLKNCGLIKNIHSSSDRMPKGTLARPQTRNDESTGPAESTKRRNRPQARETARERPEWKHPEDYGEVYTCRFVCGNIFCVRVQVHKTHTYLMPRMIPSLLFAAGIVCEKH